MSIGEMIRQGFYYARTCKSLWLFGFFVGAASGGSSGGGGGDGGGGAGGIAGGVVGLSAAGLVPIAIALALVAVVLVVMRFISEGALIEGIARMRRGGTMMTTGEGFRAGWAHWGVLVRIALLYFAAVVGSLALLAAPCVVAMWTLGWLGAIAFAIPALLIGVPWLVTLYLVQAFASRIAVLENRHALDAIRKARLFLHGRLMHGLMLIVAMFAGSLLIAAAATVILLPVTLLLIALIPVLRVVPVIVLGCLVVLPVVYVLTAMLGTLRSSIWTIGYMTQVES
jgi:hypothetical protein